MRLVVRLLCLVGAICLVPATSRAEWQLRPFAGVTFGGSTTYYDPDLEQVAGHVKLAVGGSVLLQGEVLGLEADVGHTPGYFNGGGALVISSGVTTLTGNVVVALPKRIAQYTLRPYIVVGAGLLHTSLQDASQTFSFSRNLPAMDLGAGATGFLSDHVGVNWDVRLFRSFEGSTGTTFVLDPQVAERLSTWRATMGLVFRP